MNKLIKYFNNKYSKTHGKIAYPRTTLQIYQVYQIIKSSGIEDEKLNKLLDETILPKPKTTEEKEAYAECIYESVNIPASRKYVDGSFPKKTSIEDKKIYLLKENGEKIDQGTELPSLQEQAGQGNTIQIFTDLATTEVTFDSDKTILESLDVLIDTVEIEVNQVFRGQSYASDNPISGNCEIQIEILKTKMNNGARDVVCQVTLTSTTDSPYKWMMLTRRTAGMTSSQISMPLTPMITDVNKKYVDNSLKNKVDKVTGKGLSTVDFTKSYETKLKGLENYNDAKVKADIQTLKDNEITLIEDDTSMEGISDTTHDNLETTNKTIIGAINEVSSQLGDIVNEIPYDNIRNYSIIGDGVQISQEVLYNFFDNISNKENVSLFIPPGKYNMENMIFKNIENSKNLTIYGYGAEFYWETCSIPKNMFSFKNCENINILGVKFKGAGMKTSINANEDILNFHLCKNIKVRDCVFTDIGSVAIRFGFGHDDTEDNPIENVILEDCYFENVFQIGTTPSGCINYKCLNNTFINIGGSVKFAQRYKKGYNITIEGNYILANNQDSVQSGIEIYGYSNIYVKNNYIKSKNNGILIYNNDEKKYIGAYQDITIEDNEIYAVDKNGIYLKNDDDTDVNNIKVANNKITILHTKNSYYPLAFEGKGFKNLFICNNNFTDVEGYAIEFNCTSTTNENNNFVIENNKCSNVKNFIVVRKDINELKLVNNNFNISNILIGLLANVKKIYMCDNILKYNYSDFTDKNIESMYIKNNILECNRVYEGGNISNAYSQNNIFNKPGIEGYLIKQQTGNYHGVDNFYNLENPLLSLNGAKMYDKSINYKTNGVPTSVPLFVGQVRIDADNSKIYIAKDKKEVSDWICLN